MFGDRLDHTKHGADVGALILQHINYICGVLYGFCQFVDGLDGFDYNVFALVSLAISITRSGCGGTGVACHFLNCCCHLSNGSGDLIEFGHLLRHRLAALGGNDGQLLS